MTFFAAIVCALIVTVLAPLVDDGGPLAIQAKAASADAEAAAAADAKAAKTAAAEAAAATRKAVRTRVQQAAEQGVTEQAVVLDRTSGTTIVAAGGDESVPAMSLVKLFIATDVLYSVGGVDKLSASKLKRLTRMIAESNDVIAGDWYGTLGAEAIVYRTVKRYGLTGTYPAPDPRYWGDIRTTAADVATLLQKALASSVTGRWLAAAMQASADEAADGFDQDFGVNALAGAGSKQGWGCCLGGVVALHTAGFTADRVIVVLSTSYPDASVSSLVPAAGLEADPGAQTAMRWVTATAKAAA